MPIALNRTVQPLIKPGRRQFCATALGAWLCSPVAGQVAGQAASLADIPAGNSSSNRPSFTPLLAREWPVHGDPAGFLVSEKFDGVRALWDGQSLRFRSGRLISAPAWFIARLPAQPLDGELWLGRGRFEVLSGLVRRQPLDDAGWQALQYQVFELPAAGGSFAERAATLPSLCAQVDWPALQAVAQQAVASRAALQQRLDEVVAGGGEGLVLHQADAPQASGRSPWLWKHKPLHDAEAQVLAHLPGQGRYAGQLGALRVRADTGKLLAIGTGFSDADRQQPPAIGQRITFTYRGLTAGGVPRFASYLRTAPAE